MVPNIMKLFLEHMSLMPLGHLECYKYSRNYAKSSRMTMFKCTPASVDM